MRIIQFWDNSFNLRTSPNAPVSDYITASLKKPCFALVILVKVVTWNVIDFFSFVKSLKIKGIFTTLKLRKKKYKNILNRRRKMILLELVLI